MMAFFDCFAGISGDMTLGAFFSLGVSPDRLAETLKAGLLIDFDLAVSSVTRMGISASRVEVVVYDRQARDYATIQKLIRESRLSKQVKALSLRMFERLAEAESAIHGCPKEKVHFHELGGVDALVDIVGTAFCVEALNLERILASTVPLGKGFVNCAHGTLPVPAPATLEVLKGVPVYGSDIPFETVTPTGAAILTTLAESFGNMPGMRVLKTGYGAGRREEGPIPNLLRIITGETDKTDERATVVETCIDDMNPEFFGFLMERLFESGALDVYLIPVYMKKNRPGTLVQVLCRQKDRPCISQLILSETTTLGVRYYEVEREVLERQAVTIDTVFGPVSAKKVNTPRGECRIVPEYEACREIAKRENIPLRTVYEKILQHIAG